MARINDPLIDVLTRQQVLIERLKASYTENYRSKTIPKLDRLIREVLQALDSDGAINASHSIDKLNQVLGSLRQRQRKAYGQFVEDFMVQNQEFAGDTATFEAKVLTAHVTTDKIGDVAAASAKVAFQLAEQMPIRATGDLLRPFVNDWTSDEIRKVEGAVRNAYYNGLTNNQLLTQIRGTKRNNHSDGILARNEQNARTTIRTAVQHVANTARYATWSENDDIVDGYTIIATMDGKTSTICRSLDGKSFDLGEGPLPPFHPNCRTTTIPRIKKEYRSNMGEGTRSSLGGYVPGSTTYYEWLKGESKEFQIKALGATRATLFRDGGLSSAEFGRLNLGRTFEPLTLAEMRKIDPTAFKRAGL